MKGNTVVIIQEQNHVLIDLFIMFVSLSFQLFYKSLLYPLWCHSTNWLLLLWIVESVPKKHPPTIKHNIWEHQLFEYIFLGENPMSTWIFENTKIYFCNKKTLFHVSLMLIKQEKYFIASITNMKDRKRKREKLLLQNNLGKFSWFLKKKVKFKS